MKSLTGVDLKRSQWHRCWTRIMFANLVSFKKWSSPWRPLLVNPYCIHFTLVTNLITCEQDDKVCLSWLVPPLSSGISKIRRTKCATASSIGTANQACSASSDDSVSLNSHCCLHLPLHQLAHAAHCFGSNSQPCELLQQRMGTRPCLRFLYLLILTRFTTMFQSIKTKKGTIS